MFVTLLVVLHATVVHPFSMGAPQGACSDGVPQHGVRPQASTAPFRVAISSDKVKGGDRVSVQLSVVDSAGNPFIGFLLQARNSTSGELSGRFYKQDSKDEYTLLNCLNLNVSCSVCSFVQSETSLLDICYAKRFECILRRHL
jgi:hypothetical protein